MLPQMGVQLSALTKPSVTIFTGVRYGFTIYSGYERVDYEFKTYAFHRCDSDSVVLGESVVKKFSNSCHRHTAAHQCVFLKSKTLFVVTIQQNIIR